MLIYLSLGLGSNTFFFKYNIVSIKYIWGGEHLHVLKKLRRFSVKFQAIDTYYVNTQTISPFSTQKDKNLDKFTSSVYVFLCGGVSLNITPLLVLVFYNAFYSCGLDSGFHWIISQLLQVDQMINLFHFISICFFVTGDGLLNLEHGFYSIWNYFQF